MNIDIAGKLFPNITTIVVQLAATFVMFLIFKKFFWQSMQEYFAARAKFIEDNINESTQLKNDAREFIEESQRQARQAAVEYRNIVEQAKIDATKTKEVMLAQANKEAEDKIIQANKEIESLKASAATQMKEEIVDVAVEIASKVVGKQMDEKTNKALVEDFCKEVVN